MVSRYKMYRGAVMHSLVCLCLVNAIFQCWGGINALWITEPTNVLVLYFSGTWLQTSNIQNAK